jgi:hypothetical protein
MLKNLKNTTNKRHNGRDMGKNMRFSICVFFTRAGSLLELKFFLTNLRLFVTEKYLGSRRAPSAGSKTQIL